MIYTKKVIDIALDEVGYLEKASNKDLDFKKANAGYNNYTKYGHDMNKAIGSPFIDGVAWCCTFVQWCFAQAYGCANAKRLLGGWTAYCPTASTYFKNLYAWYGTPKVGDQIFFKDSSGKICHTGLVYKVDDKNVYTVEGNTSSSEGVVANGGGVFKKSYSLYYSKIAGYGRPKYDAYCEEGWVQDADGRWWYQYSDGSYPTSQWLMIKDKWYYFKSDGYMASDEYIKSENYEENELLYYVALDGAWNNKTYKWFEDNVGWWLADSNGDWYAQNEWAKVDGKWYYFGDDGYMIHGDSKTIHGTTYYFADDGALIE